MSIADIQGVQYELHSRTMEVHRLYREWEQRREPRPLSWTESVFMWLCLFVAAHLMFLTMPDEDDLDMSVMGIMNYAFYGCKCFFAAPWAILTLLLTIARGVMTSTELFNPLDDGLFRVFFGHEFTPIILDWNNRIITFWSPLICERPIIFTLVAVVVVVSLLSVSIFPSLKNIIKK